MLIGYARVSTDEQDAASQIAALSSAGVEERRIYVDLAHVPYCRVDQRTKVLLDLAVNGVDPQQLIEDRACGRPVDFVVPRVVPPQLVLLNDTRDRADFDQTPKSARPLVPSSRAVSSRFDRPDRCN